MPATAVSRARSFLIRSLALVAAVATYAVSSVGVQVLGAAGVSSVLSFRSPSHWAVDAAAFALPAIRHPLRRNRLIARSAQFHGAGACVHA